MLVCQPGYIGHICMSPFDALAVFLRSPWRTGYTWMSAFFYIGHGVSIPFLTPRTCLYVPLNSLDMFVCPLLMDWTYLDVPVFRIFVCSTRRNGHICVSVWWRLVYFLVSMYTVDMLVWTFHWMAIIISFVSVETVNLYAHAVVSSVHVTIISKCYPRFSCPCSRAWSVPSEKGQ